MRSYKCRFWRIRKSVINADQQQLEDILRGLGRSSVDETKILLTSLRPNEVAMALEANLPNTRRVIWQLLDDEARNQSLQYLREDGSRRIPRGDGYRAISGGSRRSRH